MQEWITWFCGLIGVTSPGAIEIVVGLASAGLLVFGAAVALGIIVVVFRLASEFR